MTDPYGSGSVPRIRRIFMKITKFLLFCSQNHKKIVIFLVFLEKISFATKCITKIEKFRHYCNNCTWKYLDFMRSYNNFLNMVGSGSVKISRKGFGSRSVRFSRIRTTLILRQFHFLGTKSFSANRMCMKIRDFNAITF